MMKREILERDGEPLQLNEKWFLSLDSEDEDKWKELVTIINMILRGQHYTNETLENVAKALHERQANTP